MPLSYVLLTPDCAAVRPAPGVWPAIDPGYALTLRRAERGTTWLRQVGQVEPATAASIAERLDRALTERSHAVGGHT